MRKLLASAMMVGAIGLTGCKTTTTCCKGETMNTFAKDAAFMKKHTDAIVLKDGQSAIVVVPEYQGRVMTATAQGDNGLSSGWINYDLVKQGVVSPEEAKGKLDEHMYAFGGEERFWMGPEGGQYSIYFEPGTEFDFKNWFTPDPIDNEKWKVTSRCDTSVVFNHDFKLLNHSGTKFDVGVERTVSLLDSSDVEEALKAKIPNTVDLVAYKSVNTVTNNGQKAWEHKTGLVSIWMLSMFTPSPTTTVFIPYEQGSEDKLGPVVNADYFGRIPDDRLKSEEGVIYFTCDGKQRGKLGLTPERAKGWAGSYDPAAKRMTLLFYSQPNKHDGYVNSMWELQDKPYEGDVLNSYNDGPVDESGEQMGPFYELESSSPALALKPKASASHSQTVIHFYGEEEELQKVLSAISKISLAKVKTAL